MPVLVSNRLENLLGNGRYHCDWISNADKGACHLLAVNRRQKSAITGYVIRPNRRLPITIFCRAMAEYRPRADPAGRIRRPAVTCWKS